jgi:hypothetical protein
MDELSAFKPMRSFNEIYRRSPTFILKLAFDSFPCRFFVMVAAMLPNSCDAKGDPLEELYTRTGEAQRTLVVAAKNVLQNHTISAFQSQNTLS